MAQLPLPSSQAGRTCSLREDPSRREAVFLHTPAHTLPVKTNTHFDAVCLGCCIHCVLMNISDLFEYVLNGLALTAAIIFCSVFWTSSAPRVASTSSKNAGWCSKFCAHFSFVSFLSTEKNIRATKSAEETVVCIWLHLGAVAACPLSITSPQNSWAPVCTEKHVVPISDRSTRREKFMCDVSCQQLYVSFSTFRFV